MNIIGINCYHNGSSAALVQDGFLKSAISEERLNRIKNTSKFPINSIKSILMQHNLTEKDIDFYCVNSSGHYFSFKKFLFIIKNFYKFFKLNNFKTLFSFNSDQNLIDKYIPRNKLIYVDHHLSHLESAFLTSNFDDQNRTVFSA